jgi:hypothetical protein
MMIVLCLQCCLSSLLLILLQRDTLLLPSLSPGNRATPTVMAAVLTLVLSSLLQSRLWASAAKDGAFGGFLEVS